MKKTIVFMSILAISLSSCGTKKKLAELEAKNKECQDLLNTATVKLNLCLTEKDAMAQQIDILKKTNTDLISNVNNLTMLSSKGAENLEKSLESLKEKDLRITRLQDAMTRKDSVTFALVTSLKGAVGISDPDIQVNVEKGVVMINIADKLLFKSGSYEISSRAQEILGKVAKVINERPEFECMVESHTDNVPYRNGLLLDNWDLSAKRATAVVRMLTKEHKVDPKQMIAAGRGEFVPLMANTNAENRAANRRTRIIVMPKIDQFYDMIEKEMKKQSGK
ncbi:MAG: flagellar motor protein MotB [Flavobacterium sp.]